MNSDGTRILVVDDQADLARGTELVLQQAGYVTALASGGAQALQILPAFRPHLVLLDRDMPGPDGLEVCRQIKADLRFEDVFVVFLSGAYTQAEEQMLGLESGADGYVARPIGNRELLARVAAFVRIARLNRRLADEITERRLLEAELEQRVRLRTAELEGASQKLERARRAAVNLMQDADLARQALARANLELRREVAQRKEAEIAASQLAAIVEFSEDAIVGKNLNSIITSWNRGAETIFGYAAAEMVGTSILRLIPADRQDEENFILEKIRRGASVGHFETLRQAKDGRLIHVSVTASPIKDATGAVVGVSKVVRDITPRKQAEAERERLEAQNRHLQKSESLNRMAGSIAHHFNNQLHVVLANLELARHDLPAPETVGLLADATTAARKAAEVSSLMLTYLGQSGGQLEPLDLADTCRRHIAILRAAAPPGLTWETHLPAPGPVVLANASQIQQVLTNLATNAWEAMSGSPGSIRLAVKTVPGADIPPANRFPVNFQAQAKAYACLEVADAGGGIPAEHFERIFDPFFSNKFAGRGMGLAVVLGTVRARAGAVTVESEPACGSVFRVFLPVSEEAVPPQPAGVLSVSPKAETGPAAPASPARRAHPFAGTVLVVEDEPSLRKVVGFALARLGYAVLTAQDGVEALEVFRQHREQICCVLCDLTMPRLDGWETLAALRKLDPNLPVILASGYSKTEVMAGEHAEWPQAFLSKPYESKALATAVTNALHHEIKAP